MSWIKFKGTHSDDIKAIIENLPPVVKPPKRYELKEVDGRDGAEVEILGYKAYEKVIPIGFKEANITNIFDWLDGEGQLILSNEPDKYYVAEVLDRIDYKKAISFRKAEIPFLVQPYKYAIEYETTATTLFNRGNVKCYPLMTIYGTGAVGVLVNGVLACTLTITDYMTLDCEEQEAYKGAVSTNRLMVGDFPEFIPGTNVLTFTGTVTEVKTTVRSRWL
jgi:predicted phage tail component-like protein